MDYLRRFAEEYGLKEIINRVAGATERAGRSPDAR